MTDHIVSAERVKKQTLAEEFAHVRNDGLTGEQYVRDYNRGWVATSLESGDYAGASEA